MSVAQFVQERGFGEEWSHRSAQKVNITVHLAKVLYHLYLYGQSWIPQLGSSAFAVGSCTWCWRTYSDNGDYSISFEPFCVENRTPKFLLHVFFMFLHSVTLYILISKLGIQETPVFNKAICRTAVLQKKQWVAFFLHYSVFTQQSIRTSLLRVMSCFGVWVMSPHKNMH